MKFRLVSDLHLEWDSITLSRMEDEDQQILTIAGDLCEINSEDLMMEFFDDHADRFKRILYVCGNHEFYGTDIDNSVNQLKTRLEDYCVTVLDDEIIEIDGVRIKGSTMWSSMNNNNPLTKSQALFGMNDYSYIKTGDTFFDPEDSYQRFIESINFIFEDSVDVVISHHGCSHRSVTPNFKNYSMIGCYVSELDEEIIDSQIKLWMHGHIHDSVDYEVGGVRVISNPRGYVGRGENEKFNDRLVIEV